MQSFSAALIVFAGSGFFLFLFFVLKYVEAKREKKFFAGIRGRADARTLALFDAAKIAVPRVIESVRHQSKATAMLFAHNVALIALSTVRFLEQRLVGVVSIIRRGRRAIRRNPKNVSSYLQNINGGNKENE